jgi:uncharacterized protein
MAAPPTVRGNAPRGIGFPIEKGREGYWPRRNSAALRQSSITMILGTLPGERVGEPTFGSHLRRLIFEPNDQQLVREVHREVVEALRTWDPFVGVQGVAIEQHASDLRIFIDYIDLSDPDRQRRRAVHTLRA